MTWYNPFSWGEKVATDILDKDGGLLAQAGSWIGGLKLTPEEVMEYNGSTVSKVLAFVEATLDENTARSKARRAIAMLWIKAELALILMTCICAPWDIQLAEFYFKIASSGIMFGGTTAVIIFFFGSYGIARIKSTKQGTSND